MNLDQIKETIKKTETEIGKIIVGQEDVIRKALIVIFTGNHALIEGVPGVAKTLLVRTLGKVLGCETNRIQFTPDLMPSDIVGTNIFNLQKNEFNVVHGPIFTSFLLGDEINRAPAKTQSALLQAMQEREVTIDRQTYKLPENFTVFATQNPIEHEGTYPLPEAQKDRFMLKITMGFPTKDQELVLAKKLLGKDSPESLLNQGVVQPILSSKEVEEFKNILRSIVVRDELVDYMVNIIRKTREEESIFVGAGPRGTKSLVEAARAHALFDGRDFVTPDDVKIMALPVLEHRLILRPEVEVEGVSVAEVIQKILQEVKVPR